MSKVFTITEGLENLGALRTGGQGSVYKGKRIGAIYTAVKLIPTPIYTEDHSDKNYSNFENEVAKLQKVNENPCPNVVKMLSFGITESGSFPFIEMEYIDGPDLEELLQPPHDKVFPLKELVKVADQLAGALAHCHKMGVKHGDIKSNNVKYNVHTGNYVLLDFGLAIMSEEQRRTSIRHAGAIEFMAPEQNEGKMLFQTDVYSYGVILYELLAGQVPFPLHGNSDTGRNSVMLGHMENKLPDVMQLRSDHLPNTWSEEKRAQEMQVPAWLLNLIGKCLQKDPENRFANGMELHEALVNTSLAVTGIAANNPIVTALKEENEELKEQLSVLQSQEPTQERSGIVLSKFAFSSLLIGLVGFMFFAAYATFFVEKKPVVQQVKTVDSVPLTVDTGKATEELEANRRAILRAAATKRAIDSALKQDMKEASEQEVDSVSGTEPDTTNYTHLY
jgi:serine/threonine protein kinase